MCVCVWCAGGATFSCFNYFTPTRKPPHFRFHGHCSCCCCCTHHHHHRQKAADLGILGSPAFKQLVSGCLLSGVLSLVVLTQVRVCAGVYVYVYVCVVLCVCACVCVYVCVCVHV